MAKNNEIVEINSQLKEDLKVCQRHLENVVRSNKIVENELGNLHQANLTAIKKLQEPFAEKIQNFANKNTKWELSSRATGSDSGDF